jgi:hypothetical protein
MMGFRLCAAAIVVGLLPTASMAASKLSLKDRQRAACFNDVQTLCGVFLPDEDTTANCMQSKRAQISPACAKYYPETPPK